MEPIVAPYVSQQEHIATFWLAEVERFEFEPRDLDISKSEAIDAGTLTEMVFAVAVRANCYGILLSVVPAIGKSNDVVDF